MFEFTSPRKLGSVNSNMNPGVLEDESVKFSPFSGELHLEFSFPPDGEENYNLEFSSGELRIEVNLSTVCIQELRILGPNI